ncbi:MAG: PIN domain-containing protein [Myxococcales bacterium]|nr:PIN domain-containing protein [Myxococcales bacterium]
MIESFDTSVLVAAAVVAHPFHAAAVATVSDVERRGGRATVCSHALAECFATLTRLPVRPAITSLQAERFVLGELVHRFAVEPIRVDDQLSAIRLVIAGGLTGSAVHDGLHVAVAQRLGAARLWTFNPRHFLPLWDPEHIVIPA